MPRHTPLAAEFIRSILDYDPTTGILTWRSRPDMPQKWNSRYAGKPAGTTNRRSGYSIVQIGTDTAGKKLHYLAHQLAWTHFYGVWPAAQLDHRHGVRDDNRISELRQATNSQNGCNKAMQRNNKSGFVGVHFNSQNGKWTAKTSKAGRRYHFGFFETAEQAAAERERRIREIQGEFTPTNPQRRSYRHPRDH